MRQIALKTPVISYIFSLIVETPLQSRLPFGLPIVLVCIYIPSTYSDLFILFSIIFITVFLPVAT
jgi:hypothetical protein